MRETSPVLRYSPKTEILDLRADCSTEILRMNVACNGLLEFDPLLENRATF
jgi:hypothetical protein